MVIKSALFGAVVVGRIERDENGGWVWVICCVSRWQVEWVITRWGGWCGGVAWVGGFGCVCG